MTQKLEMFCVKQRIVSENHVFRSQLEHTRQETVRQHTWFGGEVLVVKGRNRQRTSKRRCFVYRYMYIGKAEIDHRVPLLKRDFERFLPAGALIAVCCMLGCRTGRRCCEILSVCLSVCMYVCLCVCFWLYSCVLVNHCLVSLSFLNSIASSSVIDVVYHPLLFLFLFAFHFPLHLILLLFLI